MLAIENIKIMFKPFFLKQFYFIKTLRYLYDAFEIREEDKSVKKVIGTQRRLSTKSAAKYKKLLDNADEKPTRGFSLQHKTFNALNYAQDFGITVKESLKTTRNSKGYTQEKPNCPVSNTFSDRCKQCQKKLKL